MPDELMDYFDKKFESMETSLKLDAQAKHLEVMQYLQQLIIEQFKTRMELGQLTKRVEALEGKKANGGIHI